MEKAGDNVVAQALSFRIDEPEGEIAVIAAEFVANTDLLGTLYERTGCSVNLCDAWLQKNRIYVPVHGEADIDELQHCFLVPIKWETNVVPCPDEPGEGVEAKRARHIPERAISGGQSGADLGGLVGARRAGIPTGGVAPKNYMTEKGPQPEALKAFGLIEDDVDGYGSRTEKNAAAGDVTIIFAKNQRSGGTGKTIRSCVAAGKPYLLVNPFEDCIEEVEAFLAEHKPKVLNVAGNRETVAPGIASRVAGIIAAVCSPEPRQVRERSREQEQHLEP